MADDRQLMLVGRQLRRLLRIARDLAIAAGEQFWALGFALAGWRARRPVRRWSSPGGQRILAIAPHPDDEVCGCAGTLIRHRRCGDTVCVAYITDGRRSRALGLGPDEMARRRRREAEASGERLAARVAWFGLPEGEWQGDQLRPGLGELIREFGPDLIYAPSLIDFHPEHYLVAHVLGSLLADRAGAPQVRVYQVQVPLTPALTNLVADVSDLATENAAALRVYATQWGNVARTLRMRRYGAAFYGLPRQAEEFWELPAGRYRRLHATAPECWSPDTFRSLRFYPWGDILAYLQGRAARRRAAMMA